MVSINNKAHIFIVIIVLLALPVNGFMGEYRYETCDDVDLGFRTNVTIESQNYYICKIGYIDGNVSLGWEVSYYNKGHSVPTSIHILNNDNMKKFVEGEAYGFSNAELSSLYSTVETSASRSVDVTLVGDIYYLVMNTGYRQSFDEENVEPKGRLNSFLDVIEDLTNFRDQDKPVINCAVDLDYIDEDSRKS